MSNTLFENPKVALGFSGVVVAVALIASVAFQELSGSDKAPQEAVAAAPAAQAAPQPAQAGFAANSAAGWSDDGAVTDDWGATSVSPQSGSGPKVQEQISDVPEFGDRVANPTQVSGRTRSSGAAVTSSAAPGAPDVQPPQAGGSPEVQAVGN
ncbi:hypothetical protein EH31_06105 [Erythrobacter longus]|uniref:Uncharacterized protein n=1 Tax=Erythrobacter longus TaxID=1044 RepID=A0A074M335_ERYLO|nr:hypothetical protein [Erythrobacter longus]KEO87724.1 hypothetical protein EH31_06105 [Erythrobacter longus]